MLYKAYNKVYKKLCLKDRRFIFILNSRQSIEFIKLSTWSPLPFADKLRLEGILQYTQAKRSEVNLDVKFQLWYLKKDMISIKTAIMEEVEEFEKIMGQHLVPNIETWFNNRKE